MAKNSKKALMMDEESEEENLGFSVNKDYAEKYNRWREKEEFQKLKDRYGDSAALLRDNDDEETSSTSESEDEVGEAWTEEMDRDFFKTLASLKKKDSKIYDPNSRFFEGDEIDLAARFKKGSKKEEKPMYIRDYQRQLLLEKGGQISDEEEEKPKTYVQEQQELKNSFKDAFADGDESDDGLLVKREKTQAEKNQEEAEYKAWLKGQKDSISDPSAKAELQPLREFWTNPKLDKEETFLRDYILNKRYLDSKDDTYIPTYDEIVHDSEGDLSEDEKTLEQQAEFEHKFNFRFEEPDPEFIKRYPRTIEDSLRRKDTSRKEKRDEVKERKRQEKETMKEELKQLKLMKRREIEEKLDKLKEITGNPNLGLQEDVFNEDFDPEKHDKLMQEVFNEDYYAVDEGETKPEFPDEEELDIENWDAYEGKDEGDAENGGEENYGEDGNDAGPHCEDPDFNMDCDYDPNQKKSLQDEILAMTGPRKKNRRQSLFAKAVQKKKPAFDPDMHKKFESYIDEYYKLDFEDVVGDLPVRFKYRTTVPNDFGLDVEEILLARDKELNKWCSVKKTCQYRNDDEEIRDQKAYSSKKNNIMLKKKILTSVFSENPEEQLAEEQEERKEKRKKRKKISSESENPVTSKPSEQVAAPSKKLKLEAENVTKPVVAALAVSAPTATVPEDEKTAEQKSELAPDAKPKNKRNKKKKKKKPNAQNGAMANGTNSAPAQTPPAPAVTEVKTESKPNENVVKDTANQNGTKKAKKLGKRPLKKKEDFNMGLSDERLKAYGFNPKKFKNKLKYGKKAT